MGGKPGAEGNATRTTEDGLRRRALGFVVLLGVVSLFADMTYEGARSITGPFLALLGASGAIVGLVAGFGELVGYGLRLASGYLADRTKRYWGIAIFGYVLNLLAVPAIALAGRWEVAALLMIAERTGSFSARQRPLSSQTSALRLSAESFSGAGVGSVRSGASSKSLGTGAVAKAPDARSTV